MASCPTCGKSGFGIFEVRDGKCPSCRYQEERTEEARLAEKKAAGEQAIAHSKQQAKKLLVTTETFVGSEVERLGIVAGEIVLGMGLFKDFAANFRDVFGGRSGVVQNTLRDARELAFDEVRLQAAELGATAVIAVSIHYHSISTGTAVNMMIVSVTGTAVRM
ncbi:MAG: YbjQ family protein [Novosphingobium sp.]|nr:YbjQ family protein [Novosphingobium sp.]